LFGAFLSLIKTKLFLMKKNYNLFSGAFMLIIAMFFSFAKISAQTVTLNAVLSGKVTSTDVLTNGDETNICSSCDRGYLKFDLSSIPVGATISSASLKLVAITPSTSSTSTANKITSTTLDAATAGAGFYAAINTATTVFTGNWAFASLPNTYNMTINAAGITALNTALAGGQITYGVVRGSTNVYTFGGYNNATSTNQPQLTVTYAFPCTGTPNPGTALISNATGCSGNATNLSASGLTGGPGITYQWESSPDNLAWTPIVGATTDNYTTTPPAGISYYRIVTTCSNGGATNNSSSVSFTGIACTPTNIPATGSSIIACGTNTNLYDDGGPSASYAVSASGYTVLQNSGTGVITLSGTYSGVETCCDNIRIYDGSGTGGTLLFTYGAAGAGTITTFVSAPGQSITVQLNSDGSVQGAGFAFQVIYSGACAVCLGTPTAGATASVPASVNIGQSFTLSLAGAGVESGLTYQWQSSPDGITYTNIGGATASTYTGTETASTYYQCIVTCTSSGFSATSTPLQVPFNNVLTMTNGSVTVCNLNFYDSGGATGDYSNSETYTLTVYPSTPGSSIQAIFNAFSVETCCDDLTIYDGNSTAAPLIGTYTASPGTILSTALDGSLTFVFSSDGSVVNPGWDATLNCVTACAGTPVAGATASTDSTVCSGADFTLSLSGASIASGISYQWQSSPDGITYADITGATNSTYTGNQASATYYQCIVTCTNGGAADTSSALQIIMNSYVNCYCPSNATTPDDEEILNVTLGTINNSSTCTSTGGPGSVLNQYSDYTTLVTAPNLAISAAYPVSLQIGTCGGTFTNSTRIFIDFNQNGLFTDPGETVYTSAVGTAGAHTESGTITIPLTALTGATRMRVVNVETGTPTSITPCGTYGFGETEDYLVNIVPLPANPPTPVQDLTPPTCAAGTALTVPGSPAIGDAWYWQTAANGTSTTNPVSGPYTVFLNGTYYVRTYNATYNVWSANSDSVVVTNMPLAALPPAPTAAASPACLNTAISIASPAPGIAYFWQGTTVNGTSITQNASTPYIANATGTYYVSAYDSTTSCWSNTNGVAVIIDTFIPQAPVASADVSICAGSSSAIVSATTAGSGSQIVTFGTSLVSSGTGTTTYTATIPALPLGATITGTQLEIMGATANGGSFRSEIRVALSGAIALAPTQISTLASAGLITPDPILTVANPLIAGGAVNLLLTETFDDAGNDATFTEIRLIINYTLPVTTISWFNAATAGTSLGTVSPLETVGTSVLPNTTTAGTYTFYVAAISGSCSSTSRDSVAVIVNALPVLTLNDTAVCTGSSYTINAQNAGSTYVWNTTATTQSIPVTLGGLYYVDITTAAGCVARDSMNLILNSLPIVNLGADVAFCAGDSITLDAGNTGMNYLWNNVSASTTQTINASQTGNYIAIVTNPTTLCSNADTILVTVNANPVQNLGPDTTQCAGTITLNAGVGNNDYLWNDNSTAQTLIASVNGTYSVLVTDSITGCFSNDTVVVTINPLPIVDLGLDSVQCGGSIALDAGNVGATYLWSDSTTAQILTATTTAQYYVTVTNTFACSSTDSVSIVILNLPVVNLGSDSTQCGGGIVLDAGAGNNDYLWSDNTTAQTLTVFVTGQYAVTVSDTVSGCIATDTINVSLNQYPIVNLGSDTTQCAGTIVLDADNTGASFLWSNTASTQTITVTSSGQYSVAVTSSGCTTNDTINVTINLLPLVGLSPFTTPICNDLTAYTLTNGNPVGGVYSGSNVTGNTFNSVAAGVGSHPITYTVTDTNGCSNSSTQNITVQSCTGIEELNAYEVVVYPNPTSGVFTIAIKNANIDELIISVVDIQGKEVFGSRESNIAADYNKQINLEGLSKGMYYIKLSTGADVKIQKLIVQ